MRFNKSELAHLAGQSSSRFDKEGILMVKEKQDGFFRESEISLERWCRLRGNLLFYMKTTDPFSEPVGLIVLEQCQVRLEPPIIVPNAPPSMPSSTTAPTTLHAASHQYSSSHHWSTASNTSSPAPNSCSGSSGHDQQYYYPFYLVFEGCIYQAFATTSSLERTSWMEALQQASYEGVRAKWNALRQCIERRRHNVRDMDVQTWRRQRNLLLDVAEVPLCELSLGCDNLLCDGDGRPPNPCVCVDVLMETTPRIWVRYGRTETLPASSNPQFLTTLVLRTNDQITDTTAVRFTVLDVREPLSDTVMPLGSACVQVRAIREAGRIRIALHSGLARRTADVPNSGNSSPFIRRASSPRDSRYTQRESNGGGGGGSGGGTLSAGFLTICVWTMDEKMDDNGPGISIDGRVAERTPQHCTPAQREHHATANSQITCHRRSQSLPPRLGIKMRLPNHAVLKLLYTATYIQTYRFHSGLGGDICVHEIMAESRLCFRFPQQLLRVWIEEEKELLQEVAGMGELQEPWHSRQLELLDRHLHLLRLYSQARENLQGYCDGTLSASAETSAERPAPPAANFKSSSRKFDRSLEFAPTNLHLQRMWVGNDTLHRFGFYDWITVGAFAAHSHKSHNGGLIRLVQQLKESPLRTGGIATKISMAHDAIQAIKQLRKDVVDSMRALMRLAKEKQTMGMLPLCEDMVAKTRILLTVWDAGLVEEALNFVEQHKLVVPPEQDEQDDSGVGPEIDDSGTLINKSNRIQSESRGLPLSPFKLITQQLNKLDLRSPELEDFATPSTPIDVAKEIDQKTNSTATETQDTGYNNHNNVDAHSTTSASKEAGPSLLNTSEGVRSLCSSMPSPEDENNFVLFPDCEDTTNDKTTEQVDQKAFLDTGAMCKSPSANYYQPTDEPEPWDLTQLNIEASVMCLVSKIKFLCGRCSSPAVRLRARPPPPPSLPSQDRSSTTPQPPLPAECVPSPRPRRNGNKFTDGLDLAKIDDWAAELRPSMRKLRQAMDGLLKTARLTHAVFRVQEDHKAAQRRCNVRYRRDVCFSQALTALVVALMNRLWCVRPDPVFLHILRTIGPLAGFEGLLSYYNTEIDLWGDMSVAVEDLRTVTFSLIRHDQSEQQDTVAPAATVSGTRNALLVSLPVPDNVYVQVAVPLSATRHVSSLASHQAVLNRTITQQPPPPITFHVTPIFFNVGINEKASLAESMGATRPQQRANIDNYACLHEYHVRMKKVFADVMEKNLHHNSYWNADMTSMSGNVALVDRLLDQLRDCVNSDTPKNVRILHVAAEIFRKINGLRFISCKSAKDRTGMAVTLEQCQILSSEYHLAEPEFQRALNCMRSEGCRRENTFKNINVRRYAFDSVQMMALPELYRPPPGSYGSAQT